MISCYKCEKCGKVFDDINEAEVHENKHFTFKHWYDENDQKVVDRNTEWISELYAPSAICVPMVRTFYGDGEWKTETSYVKYYYAKQQAEEVFPIDESIIG